MNKTSDIKEYIHSLKSSPRLKQQVVYHAVLPGNSACWSAPKKPWPDEIKTALQSIGIKSLYRHQAQAIDLIRAGRNVVVATPTASGKTLIYNLPVLEKILDNPRSNALYIFPLKALAQDQLRTFKEMTACNGIIKPTAAIYDGDTSAWHRKRVREAPPNVILTNPEMLHLSFLAHHRKWAAFLRGLDIVVVDEVHTYRGIMGSHMAQVFRRLQRICASYGVSPAFIFSSATVANPEEIAEKLTGLKVKAITQSGAPRAGRNIVFLNPVEGPAQAAFLLLKASANRGLRTIVYTQSRKLTELIYYWVKSRLGSYASRISAYRSGFLPEERREIETRLARGELVAVIATSALELGIDIGDLDLCLLVGYPGTVVSTLQRGGRVGRSGQESAVVLIAGDDALDQYFIHNPQDLINRDPEAAVVNPFNPEILADHLICAAAELPLKADEPILSVGAVQKGVLDLEKKGELLCSADGNEFFSRQRAPHGRIHLRGSGNRFNIVCSLTGNPKGEIDGFRAYRETHPGAIYLHQGKPHRVDQLDLEARTVKVSSAQVNYYTRVRGYKHTEVLEIFEEKPAWGTTVFLGRLKVTDQVTGYETWAIHKKKMMNVFPLDLPAQIFETEGLWFGIPVKIQREAESKCFHFMGGIHAVEHAAIGIFPLLVMADRNDLGGISTPFHPQTGRAAVFIYDGIPGGAGMSRQAFKQAEGLLEYTRRVILQCPCKSGCPSCVHSPKCGSGNRPIDKAAAVFILNRIQLLSSPLDTGIPRLAGSQTPVTMNAEKTSQDVHFGVLDIETQRSAQEVGGWHRADLMGISCAVLYDSDEDAFHSFLEEDVPLLIEHLQQFDLIVGFNINRFDYRVLAGYTDYDFRGLSTLDILDSIYQHLGYRLSLNHLARVTLGSEKSADGLQALRWWKEGKISEIIDYCTMDVKITKDLFLYGKKNGYLLFNNKSGCTVRIPVNW